MSDSDAPTDPLADPSLGAQPPSEPEAVEGAEKMNDPDGPTTHDPAQPPAPEDDDPLPDVVP